VNIVQTRRKVFAILGEASASSPSKYVLSGAEMKKNLAPCRTDGRLLLSLEWLSITRDLDLDLGSGHTAYGRASVIDLYVHTKFH